LTWGNTASVEATRVRHRESPDVLFAKTMPKVRIRPFAGKGKERGFTSLLRHELKIFALKASWLWNHLSIKGVHPGFLRRLEESRIRKEKGKHKKL
jgi:hypothetical protein